MTLSPGTVPTVGTLPSDVGPPVQESLSVSAMLAGKTKQYYNHPVQESLSASAMLVARSG